MQINNRLLSGYFSPKSFTSENEKDNFLFYIKALCKKQKSKFIHR